MKRLALLMIFSFLVLSGCRKNPYAGSPYDFAFVGWDDGQKTPQLWWDGGNACALAGSVSIGAIPHYAYTDGRVDPDWYEAGISASPDFGVSCARHFSVKAFALKYVDGTYQQGDAINVELDDNCRIKGSGFGIGRAGIQLIFSTNVIGQNPNDAEPNWVTPDTSTYGPITYNYTWPALNLDCSGNLLPQ